MLSTYCKKFVIGLAQLGLITGSIITQDVRAMEKEDKNPLSIPAPSTTPTSKQSHETDESPHLSPVPKSPNISGAKQSSTIHPSKKENIRKRALSAPKKPLALNSIGGASKTKRILSIDGGGIRGLIPALQLHDLETAITDALSEPGYTYDAYLADHFDVFAGTSTGGIIALGLLIPHDFDPTCPKLKTSELVDLYRKKGKEMFTQTWNKELKVWYSSRYSPENIEIELKKTCGGKTKYDVVKEKLFCVPAYNISKNLPKFFSNIKTGGKPYELWTIGRSTSSAPIYYPAMLIEIYSHSQQKEIKDYYVDGGVFENNPTSIAVIQTAERFGSTYTYCILSLGTGKEKKSLNVEKIKEGGKINWASRIFPVTKRGHEGSILKKMDGLAKIIPLDYNRFDSQLKEKIGLDATDSESMQKLENIAADMIKSQAWTDYKTQFINEIKIEKNALVGKMRSVLSKKKPTLDLSGHPISGIFLKELIDVIESDQCPVTSLNLTNCRMRGDSLERLCSALQKNKSVTELNLSENGIGGNLETISKLLSKNKIIQTLNLAQNSLGLFMDKENQGYLQEMIERKNGTSTSLTVLILDNNSLKLPEFRAIFSAFAHQSSPNLKHLSLKQNQIAEIEGLINFQAMDKRFSDGVMIDLSENTALKLLQKTKYTHFKF